MTLRRLLPSILVGSVLMAATMVHAQGLDTLPARTAALKCQKALLDASARFFKSELGILAKCSNKAFACVQNPDPKARDKCIGLSPAANACSQAINGVILKQDTDFGSRIDEACSGLLAPEIFGTSGLGYDFLAADCLSNSRENFADLGNVRSCLRNVYRRSIERLFAIEAPRTREIFRETGVAVDGLLDLPGYPGCDDCSIASDAKDKKLLTGCAKAITSAGITYAATAAQVLSKCALALFSCEQSPKFLVGTKLNTCRAKAEEKCETAKLKATNAQTKVAAKVTGACRAVPKEALLGRDGANLGALACECTAVNVEPVDSLNQYLACSQLHHECRVAQLVNFAVPRLSSLLEQTKSTPTLDKILCAVPKDPPAQAASFASAGSCTARICRFLRSIRGRFSGATFGSIVKTATLKPGGKSRASLSERAHATVPPPATITKVEGDVTYAPNVSREIRIQYAANQAALLRAGEEPKLLIAVARLDGSLVANDVFELGLEPSVDATTLNVAYSPEIPGDSGCSFRLVFGVANGDQTEFVPFDLEAAACNLNGKLEFGEDCDDNNIADGDGCDHNCTFTRCGNGIVTAREACDDGNANDDFCTADCTLAGGPSPTSTALVTTPTAVSATPTRTTTPALTTTVTSTPTSTVTAGPTITISPTITAVPTTTVTATVTTASTATVTATSTAAPTATVTATTTAAPTSTVTVTITATPTVTVTTSPTPTKTPITTTTPSASPTGTATFTPTPTATRTPTRTPTPTPTATIKEIVDASGAGVGATLDQAHGVAVDGSGNVYVAGYASDNAFKITSGGTITQIINASADGFNTLDHAQDIAVDGLGNVYVTGFITNNVFKIAGTTKTEIVDASGTGTRSLAGPVSVAVGGTGNVYVSGVNSDNVLKITPGGTITEIITATGDGQGHTLNGPYGLAVDSSETVYVVGNQSDNAFKITSAGTITQIIDATGDGAGHPLNGPYGIAVNASKNVYIAGDESDNAFRITPAGTITKIIDASGDGAGNTLDGAHDIAADAAGNAYVVGSSTGNAFKITAGGAIKEIIDTTGDKLGNPLQIPFGIAVDGAGNVYVTGFISKNAFKIPAP